MQDFNKKLEVWDSKLIMKMKHWAMPMARFSIFLVYFWFGILKVLELSPASPLVLSLLDRTMPFIAPDAFLIGFGLLEMLIGLLFLIPHLERIALFVLFLHLITTIMPLFLLPHLAWNGFLVPTLEGQYMLKNILIVAVAMSVLSHLHAFRQIEK